MSGGSFDYLYCKEPEELINNIYNIETMKILLIEIDEICMAKEFENMILELKRMRIKLEAYSEKYKDLFKAIEWWKSADSGKEDVKGVIRKMMEGEK